MAKAQSAMKAKAAAKAGRKVGRPQLDLFGEAGGGASRRRPRAGAGDRGRPRRPAKRQRAAAPKAGPRVTAESLAQKQREISVSEFFVKNRHLLGFDNPQKALLTAVRECVDNSLDACEEAGILPDPAHRRSTSSPRTASASRSRTTARASCASRSPSIFGKLLYGSQVPPPEAAARASRASGSPRPACTASSPPASRCSIICRTGPRHPGPPLRDHRRHQEERAPRPQGRGDRVGRDARHPGRDRARGDLQEGPALGRRLRGADRARQPARARSSTRPPKQETIRYARAVDRAAARSRRRSSRTPTASSWACSCACCRTPRRATSRAALKQRLLPGDRQGGGGALRAGQAQARAPAAQPARTADVERLHKALPAGQDHGPADQLPLADRRGGAASRASRSGSRPTTSRR